MGSQEGTGSGNNAGGSGAGCHWVLEGKKVKTGVETGSGVRKSKQ